MPLIQDADPQNTPEMNAWREKIKKDLAAAGVNVKDDFKMEAVPKNNKVYGFPSINHDPRRDTEKRHDERIQLNPDSILYSKREYYRGRSAKKKHTKAPPPPKAPTKAQAPKTQPVKRPYPPPEVLVPIPDQETLISAINQREEQNSEKRTPLPKTIQDVYQDAIVSSTPSNGYLRMDLSTVRLPAEWRIPRENRGVIAIRDMREFKEKLEASIKSMEASTSRKMFTNTIEAYKRKLAELLKYY